MQKAAQSSLFKVLTDDIVLPQTSAGEDHCVESELVAILEEAKDIEHCFRASRDITFLKGFFPQRIRHRFRLGDLFRLPIAEFNTALMSPQDIDWDPEN